MSLKKTPEETVRRVRCPVCGSFQVREPRENLEPDKCLLRDRLAKGVICRSCVGCGWNIDEDKRRRELIRQGRSFEVRGGLKTLIIHERSSGKEKKNGT